MNREPTRDHTKKETVFQVHLVRAAAALRASLALAPNDLLRDLVYRRLWLSVLTSSFGAQIMVLALPLAAAVTLHASPTQMGALTTMETLPFVRPCCSDQAVLSGVGCGGCHSPSPAEV